MLVVNAQRETDSQADNRHPAPSTNQPFPIPYSPKMLLLQFSTSHYCRKARLALGYKGISYQVKNLTPGLHLLEIKPLTGLSTVPVLLPEIEGQPQEHEG